MYLRRRFCLEHRDEVPSRNGGVVIPFYLSLLERHAMTIVDSSMHLVPAGR